MKKTIYFLCLLGLILTGKNLNAQTAGVTISPQIQCYSAPSVTSTAYLSSQIPGATSYSWAITSPSNCAASVIATYSSGAIATINYPCCGVYTVTIQGWIGSTFVGQASNTTTIVCNSITTNVSPSATICAGDSVYISASGSAGNYTWSTGSTGSSIIVSPTVTTCYTVITNAFGCTSSAIRCIHIGGSSSLSISGNANICGGGSTTLTASGGSSYTWVPGGSSFASIVVSPSVSTCYTVFAQGCSGVIAAVKCVTVGTAPVLSISGNTNICAGSGATLTAGGATSYTWYTGSGTFTGSTIVLSPSSTTCYSLVGLSGGCYGYSGGCVNVSSNNSPTITSSNFNICTGSSTQLYASGGTSYTWQPGGSNSTFITVSPSVTTCYTLFASGCSGVNAAVRCVTVSTAPILSITGNTNICAGSSATLTASGASSYTWMTSVGNFTGSTIALTPSATTCFSLIGSNGGNCVTYTGACIYVSAGSTPSISGIFNICQGNYTTLYASGGTSYTWSPGGSNGTSISVSPSVTTCYTLAASGCSTGVNYAVRCVTVAPAPVISISGNTSVCLGNSATLTASGASTYSWASISGSFSGSSIVVTPSTTTCYTAIGANNFGCYGYSTLCVSVSQGTPITVTGSSTICAGSSVVLQAFGASNFTWMPGSLVGDSIVVTPTVSTCYTVYGSSGSGCNSYAVKCITVLPNSSVSISGANSVCSGSYIVLYASGGSSYTWSPGGAHTTSIVVSPSVSACYTLAGTGCSGVSYAVKCITVNPSPVLSVSGNMTVCAGSGATLTAAGANTYTWYTGVGTFTGSTVVLTSSANTCYSLVGTNSFGCPGFSGGCIAVQGINLTFSGNTTICSGSSTTLTVNGAQTYTWSNGMTGSSIVVSPTATTCYTVIGNNQSGCNGSGVVCVYVNPKPTIYTSSGFFCAGQSNTLSAFGANTYTWQPFGLTGANIVITPTAAGCYTVFGTSTSGCTNSVVGCYSVVPGGSVSILGSNISCSGAPLTLTATGSQNYTWMPGNIVGSTISVSPSISTCYTVISNNSGCVSSAVKCVSVQSGPTITTGGVNSMCAGSTTTLFANGASSYTWLPGNITGAVVVVTPTASVCYTVVGTNANGCVGLGYHCIQLMPRPTISTSGNIFCSGIPGVLIAQGASTYTWAPFGLNGSSISITPSVTSCYTVTGTGSNGCTNSVVGCYSVLPSPLITITGNSVICAGGSTTLFGSGALSYTWAPSGSHSASIVVSPSVSTCYTLTGANSNGCISKVVKCIIVQPGAQLNVSGANIICAGSSANLLVSGANTYTWSNGSNSPFITISPSVSTCYTVTGTTAGGCVGSAVKCVSVQPAPMLSISGPTSVCYGSSAVLVASGASSYLWNTGATTSVISIPTFTSNVYTVTGSNGNCSSVKSITVVVRPRPAIYIYRTDSIFNHDSIICAGNAVNLAATGAASYTWSTGSNSYFITVTPSVTTTYTVSGTNSFGCSNSNAITLYVSPCMGIEKNTGNIQVGIYPNPSNGHVTLQGDGVNKITYTIYDMIGRELLKGEVTDSKQVDLSGYSNGTYVIGFKSGDITRYKKLIIEK